MPTYQVQADHYMTSTLTLHSNADYQKVAKVMDTVRSSGAVALGAGSCIGMSRLVYSALKHKGINSRLVECQVTYTYHKDQPNESTNYIGFDDIKNPGEIDTHVVIVTDTNPPLLIDASLTHRIGGVIIDVARAAGTDGTFGDYDFTVDHLQCLYQLKPVQKVPLAQQMSFVDRMQTDEKIFGNLKWLRIMIVTAIIISFINASRGFYDYYQKYLNEDIFYGPDAMKILDNKIDKLTETVEKFHSDHK